MGQQQRTTATDTVVLSSAFHATRATTAALVARLERSLELRDLALPSLPEVALRIRKALADDTVSVSEIVRLLGADPALAGRVLKIANGAMFYRGAAAITSLRAAVNQLGYKMVRNVALSFAAQQVFIGYGSRAVRELVGGIWQHSVRTAVLAHMLARVRTKLDADEAFLAGLLHEVGKLYILMSARGEAELLTSDAEVRSVMDAFHARIGRIIVEAWELPLELAVAVGTHEDEGLEAPDPPTFTAVLALANFLAEHSEAAQDAADSYESLPSFGALAVDKPTFDWLMRAADVDVRLLMIAFGL